FAGQPARAPAVPSTKAGLTCTLACNMPNGLIIRLHGTTYVTRPSGIPGQTQQEPVKVEEWRQQLNGTAIDREKVLNGEMPSFVIANGYALTPNIDLAKAERWFEEHKH